MLLRLDKDPLNCSIYEPGLMSKKATLTLKQLGIFFSKCNFTLKYCSLQLQYFCMTQVQYKEYLVSIADTDDLVLKHSCVSSCLWVKDF